MDPIEFVRQIRKHVIDLNLSMYRESFAEPISDTSEDSYGKRVTDFFYSLDSKEKEVFFEIIRQIEVDTVSTLFGLLDGVFMLENQEEDFVLTIENNPEVINGDLQSLFLEQEEENF